MGSCHEALYLVYREQYGVDIILLCILLSMVQIDIDRVIPVSYSWILSKRCWRKIGLVAINP